MAGQASWVVRVVLVAKGGATAEQAAATDSALRVAGSVMVRLAVAMMAERAAWVVLAAKGGAPADSAGSLATETLAERLAAAAVAAVKAWAVSLAVRWQSGSLARVRRSLVRTR